MYKKKIFFTAQMLSIALLLALALAVASVPLLTSAHGDEVHDDEVGSHEGGAQITQLQTIISLLQQYLVLLTKQVEMRTRVHSDGHDDHDDHTNIATAALKVKIELHSNQTHVHLTEPGKAEDTFTLDIPYTQEDAIIAAIAARTGLSAHDIEAVIEFPSGEVDEHGDSIHDDDHGDHEAGEYTEEELAGMHIMNDGTVMLGSGEAVAGATVTDDGMIKLPDGTLVEPKFDLR